MLSKLFSTAMRRIVTTPPKAQSPPTNPLNLFIQMTVKSAGGKQQSFTHLLSQYKALSPAEKQKYIDIAASNRKACSKARATEKAAKKGIFCTAYTLFQQENFPTWKGNLTTWKERGAANKALAEKWKTVSAEEKKRLRVEAQKIRSDSHEKLKAMAQ